MRRVSLILGGVDQLLIGESIKQSVQDVGYNQWKMIPADEPLVSAVLQSGKPKQYDLGELVGLDLSNAVLNSSKEERSAFQRCRVIGGD